MEAEGEGKSTGDQTEDDSEISNSLHASLALIRVDLSDSPPPMQAVPTLQGCGNVSALSAGIHCVNIGFLHLFGFLCARKMCS